MFWKRGPDLSDPMTAEILEFEGHPSLYEAAPALRFHAERFKTMLEEDLATRRPPSTLKSTRVAAGTEKS